MPVSRKASGNEANRSIHGVNERESTPLQRK